MSLYKKSFPLRKKILFFFHDVKKYVKHHSSHIKGRQPHSLYNCIDLSLFFSLSLVFSPPLDGQWRVRWVNRTFTVTQLDQQSIEVASDEYELTILNSSQIKKGKSFEKPEKISWKNYDIWSDKFLILILLVFARKTNLKLLSRYLE